MMHVVVGMRNGDPVVVQVGVGECPFEASAGITNGYIIRGDATAVVATIGEDGSICEW